MFNLKHHDRSSYADLSQVLEEEHHWNISVLTSFEYLLDVSAFAIEPISGLLAIGTRSGFIHLFGRPGVHLKLTLRKTSPIKFLQFAPSIYRLVSVDNTDFLHVWDLGCQSPATPELLISVKFNRTVNCLTLSPSHSHAFLALQSGEVKTYDLLCLQKSPYSIPNQWDAYEKKMAASGSLVTSNPSNRIPMDVVIHPRDLNLVFIVYGGGVVLFDLSRQSALHVYELILPPGAPGGVGYHSQDLLSHRHLSVTSLAIHPAGHVFAVGYADGCVAFWAVEDEDQPLLVRTIEDEDVNVVDGVKVEAYLSQKGLKETGDHVKTTDTIREPIFKLSWSESPIGSGQWGGETALTVLGGTSSSSAGVNVYWIPVVRLLDVPASTPGQTGLHSTVRTTLRKWLVDNRTYVIPTTGTIHDFLLIPRNSPHYSGSFDPIAILFLCDSGEDNRCTEAYQFPPPVFLRPPSDPDHGDSDNIPTQTCETHEWSRLRLPGSLLNGTDSVVGGQLVRLENDAYEKLVTKTKHVDDSLPLNGGMAWINEENVGGARLQKYESPQLLVTEHCDLSIRFQDISTRLRTSPQSSPIETHFPHPLPELSIDLRALLTVPEVSARVSDPQQHHIMAVHIASESLECAVILRTGESFVYRWDPNPMEKTSYKETTDREIIVLDHIPHSQARRFHPVLMLAPGRGAISAFALSDIGFLAAAYIDGSLFIVDMRKPRIILRRSQDTQNKSGIVKRHSKDIDPMNSLTWTVAMLGSSSQPCIHLVAVHKSGLMEVLKITRDADSASWDIEGEGETRRTVERPLALGTFVIDRKTGCRLVANRTNLAACLQSPTAVTDMSCILVISGAKAVKCIADITGERIGKTEWTSEVGIIQRVEIVERIGSHALVAFANKQEVLVYSLPYLKLLHRLRLPQLPIPSSISLNDNGDFIEWIRQPTTEIVIAATYASLFDVRRALPPPDIDLKGTRPSVPRHPTPVSLGPASLMGYVLKYVTSMTGDNVDALLAGPDRPAPVIPAPTTDAKPSNDDREASDTPQTSLYDRLSSALNERGQMLGGIEERFDSLERGSRSMLAQAQRLAASQTAKSWFGL